VFIIRAWVQDSLRAILNICGVDGPLH